MIQTIHMQIENKCNQNNDLINSEYRKNLYKWLLQCKNEELFVNNFLKSFVISVALFAVGIKLTNELVAWRII